MTKQFIGFTNKYYTLWTMTEEYKPLGNGCNYVVQHYYYIKNISMNKETAFSKYPGVEFVESLRGKTRSFDYEKKVWDNVDTFRFGKYNGRKIDEINDPKYIAWYWDQIDSEHKEYVTNILKSYGYVVRRYADRWSDETISGEYLMSPDDIIQETKNLNEVKNVYDKVIASKPFEVQFDKNLDDFGEYRIGNITYKFDYFKRMYYQGYEYGLPMDAKGKAKRIKNKTLELTNYTYKLYENTLIILIKDFKITK